MDWFVIFLVMVFVLVFFNVFLPPPNKIKIKNKTNFCTEIVRTNVYSSYSHLSTFQGKISLYPEKMKNNEPV